MKVLVLSTSTSETHKYADAIRALGHQVLRLEYDRPGHSESAMYERVRDFAPVLIVYVGQRWGAQPSISMLAQMHNNIAPMVHICSDAADPPWWDLLNAYHYGGAFPPQVALDGSHKWPISQTQMTALTPVDPTDFPYGTRPHTERGVPCGYAGNAGGGAGSARTDLLTRLLEKRVLDIRIRSDLPHTYEAYCDYLSRCRISLNTAWTGTESAMHVKGRILESGLAGCCVLETKGSPTADWFEPGIDYFEYENADHAAALIDRLSADPILTQTIGSNLRKKVLLSHTPDKFWQRIIDKVMKHDDARVS